MNEIKNEQRFGEMEWMFDSHAEDFKVQLRHLCDILCVLCSTDVSLGADEESQIEEPTLHQMYQGMCVHEMFSFNQTNQSNCK